MAFLFDLHQVFESPAPKAQDVVRSGHPSRATVQFADTQERDLIRPAIIAEQAARIRAVASHAVSVTMKEANPE